MRSRKVCWPIGGFSISIATQRTCFPLFFAKSSRRPHSPSPRPSATRPATIWSDASTSKAAANALALADELQASPNDVPAALARWEPPQVALGKHLRQQGSQTGNYLLCHRPPLGEIG